MFLLQQQYAGLWAFCLLFSITLSITATSLTSALLQPSDLEIEIELSMNEETSLTKNSSEGSLNIDIEYFYYQIKSNYFNYFNINNVVYFALHRWNSPHPDLFLLPPEHC